MPIYIHSRFYNLIHLNSFKYRSSTFIVHKVKHFNTTALQFGHPCQVHLRCIHTTDCSVHWKMSQFQSADSLGKRLCLWNNAECRINAVLKISTLSYC